MSEKAKTQAAGQDEVPLRFDEAESESASKPKALDPKALAEALEKTEAELKAAQEKANDHWDRLLRKEAELQNVRKRADQSVADAGRYAIERFVHDLLAVLDSFDKGLEIATDAEHPLTEGMKLTSKLMLDTLANHKVEVVAPEVGAAFDPALHEALTMQPTEEVEPNHIVTVIQKGYLLHGRLVRPAKVVVSKAP